MQSAYHNFSTVNSIQQMNGSDFQAQNWQILNGDAIRGMKLDIAKAYPENANLK
jgi:hypothetical protein